eukprot:6203213-Pleurochrysis_carterae.AAC.2
MGPFNPPTGHGKACTAIYADGDICGISPREPIGWIRSAAMFYVVPVDTNRKTMIYMGLRAI